MSYLEDLLDHLPRIRALAHRHMDAHSPSISNDINVSFYSDPECGGHSLRLNIVLKRRKPFRDFKHRIDLEMECKELIQSVFPEYYRYEIIFSYYDDPTYESKFAESVEDEDSGFLKLVS